MIAATDSEGLQTNQTVRLKASGLNDDFLLRTDKAVYDGGETIKLSLVGSGNQTVLLDVIKDRQTLLTRSIKMQSGTGGYALDLPAELSGTLQFCAYSPGETTLPVRRYATVFVRQASEIIVNATVDQAVYRPGESANLKVKLTDKAGLPLRGAISLSVVDEAVGSVQENRPGLQQAYFETDQELLRPMFQIYPWSPDFNRNQRSPARTQLERALFSQVTDFGEQRQERLREIVEKYTEGDDSLLEVLNRPDIDELAESTWMSAGAMELISGDSDIYSLSARSLPARKAEVERWKQGVKESNGMVWVIIGFVAFVGMCVTAAKRLTIGAVEICIVVVVIVTLIGMMLPAVQCAREAARRTTVLNNLKSIGLAIENYNSANGQLLADGGAPPSSPRVRQWFPETLLWRPELITDDNGMITLDVELADSITNWKVLASAVSTDGSLGASETDITVFQPFFVDLDLPVSLTRSDEVEVPIVVYNYLDDPQTIELTIEEADWFELTGPPKRTIELAANEIRSLKVRIKANKVGIGKLKVIALGGDDVGDAIEKQIQVRPEGQRIEKVANGALDSSFEFHFDVPRDAVEGSPQAQVKIYPSSFSQIVEGLDSIFCMPHGCFEQTSSTTYPSVLALDYLRQTGQSIPAVEAKAQRFIQLGYQRLLTFEVAGGGFDWFGNPPANRTLTAYGLMEFKDMAAVCSVDPRLIQRTEKWLLSQQRPDGSWDSESHMMESDPTGNRDRLATTAYIAWSLFDGTSTTAAQQQAKYFLLAHDPASIQSPYILGLISNALLAMDATAQAEPFLARLRTMQQVSGDGKMVWWESRPKEQTVFYGSGRSGRVETTAMVTLALLSARESPNTTARCLRWLISQKDGTGNWHSTQATVLALKALLKGIGSATDAARDRKIKVQLNGQPSQTVSIAAENADVMRSMVLQNLKLGADNVIRLEDLTGAGAGFQIVAQYHVVKDSVQKESSPLTIDLVYDRTEVEVDGRVLVTATVTNQSDADLPMVMVSLPVPPGFSIDRETFDRLQATKVIQKFDVTDNQVILYLSGLKAKKQITIKYHLDARLAANVIAPSARAYLYYQPEISVQTTPAKLIVVAQ